MLRRNGRIPEGHEEAVFKSLNQEEFAGRAARLELWSHTLTMPHPVLDTLRDAVELKRLNNGLMKPLLIDDLIIDTYAVLYGMMSPTLEPPPSEASAANAPATGTLLTFVPSAPGPPAEVNRNMMSLNALMNLDGTASPNPNPFVPPPGPGPFSTNIPPSDLTTRPRVKTVGRRELQRKAEACVTKPVTSTISTSTSVQPSASNIPIQSQVQPPTPSRIEIVISAKPPDPSLLHVPGGGISTHSGSGVGTAETSAPGSVHDSADDESELSELGDDEPEQEQENEGEGEGDDKEEDRDEEGEGEQDQDQDQEQEQQDEDGQDGEKDVVVVRPIFPNLMTASRRDSNGGEKGKKEGKANTEEGIKKE